MKTLEMIMMHNNNNMRKIVFIVALFMATVATATAPIDSARSYVNSNIVTNGSKAITGLKMNTALNGIIDAIDSTRVGIGVAINTLRKVDTIYANTGADSLVYKISGVRYAIAGGGGQIAFTKTKAEIDALITANDLIVGAFYKITDRGDRGIILQAIASNELKKEGTRIMLVPYAYGVGTYDGKNWIGVWHSSKSANIDDLTIWGGLVWKNLTGSIGTADDDFNLDNTNWELIPKSSFTNGEYEERVFKVAYDYNNDWIMMQADAYQNVVGYAANILGYQPCDVTDWNSTNSLLEGRGGVAIYANYKAVLGIFNNTQLDPYIISGNVTSKINNNNCGSINANTSAEITNNNNTGDISANNTLIIRNLSNSVVNTTFNAASLAEINGANAPFDTWAGDIVGLPTISGKATLTAGTATIADANITNNSIITITPIGITDAGYLGVNISSGASFTISSSNPSDARDIMYTITYK